MECSVQKLISEDEIKEKVSHLAAQIDTAYGGASICLVCVLKGGFVFTADLARSLKSSVELYFMAASSYGSDTNSCGDVSINLDIPQGALTNKHVVIAEDIIDSGRTLKKLKEYLLKTQQPASLKICALLNKPERRNVLVDADYIGFVIPDLFVVGYGLDYAEKYRNLPYIGFLEP